MTDTEYRSKARELAEFLGCVDDCVGTARLESALISASNAGYARGIEDAAKAAENTVAIRTMGLTTRDYPGDRRRIPPSQASIATAAAIRALKP